LIGSASCHPHSIKSEFNGRATERNYLKLVADRFNRRINMKNKIKVIVIAAAVAGSTSGAFAETYHHHAHSSKIERYGDSQLSEGRSSSRWGDFSTNTSTDRDSMVETPGN
jgi:hypothetical protein